ncbi:hypothetical protein HS125_05490 [bacterium]|nr:hypothetical protein [bacterium]
MAGHLGRQQTLWGMPGETTGPDCGQRAKDRPSACASPSAYQEEKR